MPDTSQQEELSQLDLIFCVDLTNSMSPFIQAAKRHMSGILHSLSTGARASLRTALVGYRDYGLPGHDPVELHPFASEVADTDRALQQLSVSSPRENSDAAEAVFAGLVACVTRLDFRPRAFKIVVLVGDAPPHGCGATHPPYPDRFEKDPTGRTLLDVSALLEVQGLTLYALGMLPSTIPVHDAITEQSFGKLATSTGGTYRRASSSEAAIQIVEAIGRKVFGELAFDRRLWEELQKAGFVAEPGMPAPASTMISSAAPAMSAKLGVSEMEVAASVSRLAKRKILGSDK